MGRSGDKGTFNLLKESKCMCSSCLKSEVWATGCWLLMSTDIPCGSSPAVLSTETLSSGHKAGAHWFLAVTNLVLLSRTVLN